MRISGYNEHIVRAFYCQHKLPTPEFEFVFSPPRKWRFDIIFRVHKVAIECQGGIWSAGRHNRGATMLKEWEKLNAAACLGWRLLYVQPRDVCTVAFVEVIREALNV